MKKLMFLAFTIIACQLHAQRVVEDFTLTNTIDGQKVSLSKFPACAGVVILFTSNSCPYDEYYRGRIEKLIKDFNAKTPVLLVNSLIDGNETPEQMTKKAQQAGITIPYLADKDQMLMQKLGATKTPHAFLLKNNGGKFEIVYSGAFDDNAQVETDVHNFYLKDAINNMLANQAVATAEVRPVGCMIRKK